MLVLFAQNFAEGNLNYVWRHWAPGSMIFVGGNSYYSNRIPLFSFLNKNLSKIYEDATALLFSFIHKCHIFITLEIKYLKFIHNIILCR